MKKLPVGVQSINKILLNGKYVYVDKTGFVKQLIDGDASHYFMSRPRRFGKSLFLNTLEEIFRGNKTLFKGFQIYDSDYKWEKHPVLCFDFAQIANASPEELIADLRAELERLGKLHGISVQGPSLQFQLKVLVQELAKENRVVVLVDEYDQPIINNLKNPEVAEKNRDLLKNFFGTLKSLDRYLKFTFVTGVSKFSQVSLFSGPNNLTDITMDPKYADMMGYTEKELRYFFSNHIQAVSEERQISEDEVVEEIRLWYNGYRFSEREVSVYNPYSTLRFLVAKKAESYWYSSGTPSFLIDQVKKHPKTAVPLNGTAASKNQLLDISSLKQVDLTALMFQTGYLTVQSYEPHTNRYQLGFPNQEVKEAFLESLIHEFAEIDPSLSLNCQEALESHHLKPFFEKLKAMLANFPYLLFVKATEGTYHAILLGLLKGMNFDVRAEVLTNNGRIDLIIELPKTTYILELKLDNSADAALQQAQQQKYFEHCTQKGKEIALLGVNFSSKLRNISDWKGALLSEDGELLQEFS